MDVARILRVPYSGLSMRRWRCAHPPSRKRERSHSRSRGFRWFRLRGSAGWMRLRRLESRRTIRAKGKEIRYSCKAFWVIPRAWVDWHAVGEILAERCIASSWERVTSRKRPTTKPAIAVGWPVIAVTAADVPAAGDTHRRRAAASPGTGPRPPQSAALTPRDHTRCARRCTATCRPPGYPSSESVTGQLASIDTCHNVRK